MFLFFYSNSQNLSTMTSFYYTSNSNFFINPVPRAEPNEIRPRSQEKPHPINTIKSICSQPNSFGAVKNFRTNPETSNSNNIKSTFAIYLHHKTRFDFLPNRDPTFCGEHIFRCVMTNLRASNKKTVRDHSRH